MIDLTQPCIIWHGWKDPQGYGKRKHQPAHRWAYEKAVGPIPAGLEIDHLCFNPPCINPAHLEPVTRAENRRRAVAARTHCRNGHPYDQANTYHWGSTQPRRSCRTCNRINVRLYKERKAAA